MASDTLSAYAKINIALIVGKRVLPLGYHRLESVFMRLALHDSIRIDTNFTTKSGNKINIDCNFDHRLKNHLLASNKSPDRVKVSIESEEGIIFKTCSRVLDSLNSQCSELLVNIRILKSVPLEAGLGGGSADAAAILNFFSKHFLLSEKSKMQIADKVGFDVAPCLYKGPSYSYYDGTHQTYPVSLPESSSRRYVLLLKPPLGCNTLLAYQALGRGTADNNDACQRFMSDKDVDNLLSRVVTSTSEVLDEGSLGLIKNDFHASVFKEIPDLELKLLGLSNFDPVITGLSGSGSSIFGIFRDYKAALKAYKAHTNLTEKGWFMAISQILSI